jgi:hypothetical protein
MHGLTVDQEANAFRDVSLKPNFSAWFVSFGKRSCAVLRSWSSTGHGDGGPKLFCDLLSLALTGACDLELLLQFLDLAGNQRSVSKGNPDRDDHNGDSRYNFDPKDASALLQAEERFKGLTGGSSPSELLARDRCTAAAISNAMDLTRIVTVNLSGFIAWLAARHAIPKNILES